MGTKVLVLAALGALVLAIAALIVPHAASAQIKPLDKPSVAGDGGLVVQAQSRGGGRGGDGGGNYGRPGGFRGGGFSIMIPIPPMGGGGDYDRPRRPRGESASDDPPPKRKIRKPKPTVDVTEDDEPKRKKRARHDPPSPPRIVARPLPRPAGSPPAPIGALTGDLRDREVLVTLADNTQDSIITALGRAHRLTRQSSFQSPTLGVRLARFRIPDRRGMAQVLNDLSLDARVLAVQPVYVYLSSQAASGIAAGVPQYAADKVRLEEAHRIARGRNVRIAIIDTGVDATHPELKGAIVQNLDVIGSGQGTAEPHGTAIAGVVVARQQLKGMAPDASVVAVRAFARASGRFEGTTETLIKGIDAGLKNGARLFNMSFTGPRDPSVEQIIKIAEGKGAIFIAAAGNGGPEAPAAYPGAYDTVIAVTAVDSADKIYAKANRGTYIALAAPGVDILAPSPKQSYGLSSGTSLAAAHVSGIVALLAERKPDLRSSDIRKLLTESARRNDGLVATDLGAGIVDAAGALAAMQ
jgi:subtilisin family serine protease